MSLALELMGQIPQRPTRPVTVVCVTSSPLTVYIDGGSTPVPARAMAGSVFTSGQSGRAHWCPPSLPICFKTS